MLYSPIFLVNRQGGISMTVLLIHFSDLHLRTNDDPILSRVSSIKNVLKDSLAESDNIIILISGDVAFSGKSIEYDLAKQFLSEFDREIKSIQKSVTLNYIIVPGNHDCCFEAELHGDTREQIIRDINANQELLEKTGILQDCLKPMQNYFDWCSSTLSSGIKNTDEQFVFERIFTFPDKTKLKFIGYNTAWMSLPDKAHDAILFPTHLISHISTDDSSDLVFSILHHPYHWIRSDVSKAFRETIEAISNIIITGHEHSSSYQSTTYLLGEETKQYIEGGELQNINETQESTFNTILVDIPNRRMKYTKYNWRSSLYLPQEFEWIDVPRSSNLRQDKFIILKPHSEFLMEPGAPLSHPRKINLTIDDIYVFPDLEELSDKPEGNFIHSNTTLDYLLTNNKLLVFGPENSGKTSLLKVMFRKYQQNGLVPLWVDGKDIRTGNPRRLKQFFSAAFKSIYGDRYVEDFWQLDSSGIALIIDDLQNSDLNRKAKLSLFDFINDHFGTALISSSSLISIQEILETEKNDFLHECKRALISEFGNVSRSRLIQKWLVLGQEDTFKELELDNRIKEIEAKSRIILRPSVAPSYPFYILTITQSVDNIGTASPILSNEDRGSFGFFYEWLITTALHRQPTRISDVSLKYRYLSELSYHMYQNNKIRIDSYELESFHNSYLQRFSLRHSDVSYGDMVNDLINCGLLKIENEYYEFRYPYVYYYFIARALNSRLQRPEYEAHVKETVSRLANQIDSDENENILLFLSYLSDNPYIRETILNVAKQMFSHNDPTDLNEDVAFINRDDFNLPMNLPDKKPREIRESIHERQDQERRKRKLKVVDTTKLADSKEDAQISDEIKAINRAFRMVRIMGHIAKNFATSWEGYEKYPITEGSYLLGLRTLKEILTNLAQSYEQFVEHVKETIQYGIEKEMVKLPPERRSSPTDAQLVTIAKLTAFIRTFIITSNGIIVISNYVGTDKLYPIYREILEKHNSLLSIRLIDVAIKLESQTHLPLESIAELLDDLGQNHLVKAILRRIAFKRMSLYETDRVEKQRCCQMLGIKQDDPRLYMPSRRIGKT